MKKFIKRNYKLYTKAYNHISKAFDNFIKSFKVLNKNVDNSYIDITFSFSVSEDRSEQCEERFYINDIVSISEEEFISSIRHYITSIPSIAEYSVFSTIAYKDFISIKENKLKIANLINDINKSFDQEEYDSRMLEEYIKHVFDYMSGVPKEHKMIVLKSVQKQLELDFIK